MRDAPHHLLRGDVPHARHRGPPGGEQVLAVWRPRDERHITRVSSLGSLARVLGRHQAVVLELGPGAAFEEGDVALASGHGEHGAVGSPAARGWCSGRRLSHGRHGGVHRHVAGLHGRVGVVIVVRAGGVGGGDGFEGPHGEGAGVVDGGEELSLRGSNATDLTHLERTGSS